MGKITVERHRWDRGKGRHLALADENGVKIAQGTDPRAMIPNPSYTACATGFSFNSGSHKIFKDWALEFYNLVINGRVIEINDNPKITEIARESLLKKEFKKFGHEIEFVD